MLRVYVYLTTGEKLKSFKAQRFDVDLGKESGTGVQRYTYTGPEGEEEAIYLNPKGVAAIELRPTKENTKQQPGDSSAGGWAPPPPGWDPQKGKRRLLLQAEDEQEADRTPARRGRGGREWPPPQGQEGPDA